MYTTRPLSLYKNSPDAISLPPEGPNSSYLVLQDDESTPTCCFGLCKNPAIKDLPFPQNKVLVIEYHVQTGESTQHHSYDDVILIPVINQPLSCNRYYAIKADGTFSKHKGYAYASSKEEDMSTCCFGWRCIRDVKPRPFDPEDIYQQFEFSVTETCIGNRLLAKSVAPDGHPPRFLRRSGWKMNAKTPKHFTVEEAQGLNPSLRGHLPDFNFPVTEERSKSVVVGKWYCPFIFIKEGTEKDQVKKSAFYEMTLEQRWQRIFTAENSYNQGNTVSIDVVVPAEVVSIAGWGAAQVETDDSRGFVWFRSIDGKGSDEHVGLSKLIIERMMWEQERVGWFKGKERQIRVVKDEEYGGMSTWRSYGCYVMVETFVLKRNNGSIVLTYDFMHNHQLRSKWE